MTGTTRWAQGARHVACAMPDGAVLMHLDRGRYYSMNATGAEVWELLAVPRTLEETVRILRERHADAPASLDSLVGAFLRSLASAGLAEVMRP